MSRTGSIHISRKEFKMFCLGVLVAVILWAVEKTPLSVSVCLALMAILVIPIVRYSDYVERKRIPRTLAFALWYLGIGVFGWHVWPEHHPHGHLRLAARSLSFEPFFPYHTGIAKINVDFSNSGTGIIRNAMWSGRVPVTSTAMSDNEMFNEFKKKASFAPTVRFLEIGKQGPFQTLHSEPLSPEDVDALNSRPPTKKMCVVAAFQWEDDAGQYETDLCGCMSPQSNPRIPPPLGFCDSGHNGEWRIR